MAEHRGEMDGEVGGDQPTLAPAGLAGQVGPKDVGDQPMPEVLAVVLGRSGPVRVGQALVEVEAPGLGPSWAAS